jgi:hypothetical protein
MPIPSGGKGGHTTPAFRNQAGEGYTTVQTEDPIMRTQGPLSQPAFYWPFALTSWRSRDGSEGIISRATRRVQVT